VVGNFTVFSIKGKDYWLIASINYKAQIISSSMFWPTLSTTRMSGKTTFVIDRDRYGSLLAEYQP